ncbi:MAG: hypothetical protein LC746_11015 [Acidobacteria bacterium]|nr:hypothetical protein [Acidobacteriota bacterium]
MKSEVAGADAMDTMDAMDAAARRVAPRPERAAARAGANAHRLKPARRKKKRAARRSA